MTKQELISTINTAFQSVTLEDGVGLWEAQGIDDYADSKTIAELRSKDERTRWQNIPYKDLVDCQSSLSFFDAKGMRFCLPQFLIFDLLADEIYEEQGINAPDVLFTLSHKLNDDYQKSRFSLFDKKQIDSIIYFLEYKLAEIKVDDHENLNPEKNNRTLDYRNDECDNLNETINIWKQKQSNVTIRKVTPKDLDALQKISRQTFYETYSAQNTVANMETYLNEEFSLEKLGSEIDNTQSEFYFAAVDNEIIGYFKLNTGDSQTELKDKRAVEIERIYVLKEFHGKNIGKLLCDKAIELARQKKASHIWLGVWEQNPRAIKFYQKNNFVEFDKHIFKLGDDKQTDIMMRLKLK